MHMIRLVTHDGHGPGWLVQAGMDDGLMGDELARGDVSPTSCQDEKRHVQ